MNYMKTMSDECVDLTLTDIPYGEVNRDSNGLRNLNKEEADVMTFDIQDFLEEVYIISSSTIIIFCGKEQFSSICNIVFFTYTKLKYIPCIISPISGINL